MAQIVTHPDNVELLKAKLRDDKRAKDAEKCQSEGWNWSMFAPFDFGLQIKTNPHMDRDKPSGKYRVPQNGLVLSKDDFRIQEGRFIEYGPDDIPYLLLKGVIEEIREPLFIQVSDEMEAFQIRCRTSFGVGFSRLPASLYNKFA